MNIVQQKPNHKSRVKMHGVCISTDLNEIIEKSRKDLGMNFSAFAKYCILHVLQEMNVLSSKLHEGSSTVSKPSAPQGHAAKEAAIELATS